MNCETDHKNPGISLALLPNAGLGNKLFPWARAAVFAKKNNIPLAVIGWSRLRPRAILRGKGGERQYRRYFVSRTRELAKAAFTVAISQKIIVEPSLAESESPRRAIYLFNKIPHWSDLFGEIREHRDLVRNSFYLELAFATKSVLHGALPHSFIAMHVRRGDFRELRPGEQFRDAGGVRTPLTYFEALIEEIRARRRQSCPVILFSDGTDLELAQLLALPNVTRSKASNDVLDLLLMSKASLIISSAGSTFSQWAGFLADSPLLIHPDHIHMPIRPSYVNEVHYEGPAIGSHASWPSLLRTNIDNMVI
jgi:hypothetical protein